MSKQKADELMQDFFKSRRAEREQEQELLQDQLDDLQDGVDNLEKNEYMAGSVLDSVNFLKHDESAAPPKTKSGTVTKAMLAKLTTPQNADLYEKKAEAAAKILGGLVHGAFATMTGEAAATNAIQRVRSTTPAPHRPADDKLRHQHQHQPSSARSDRSERRRSAALLQGDGKESVEVLEQEREELMAMRNDNKELMAKVLALENENKRLKNEELMAKVAALEDENKRLKSHTPRTPASAVASSTSRSASSYFPTANLFSSWITSSPEEEASPSKSKYTPKGGRASVHRPEWL